MVLCSSLFIHTQLSNYYGPKAPESSTLFKNGYFTCYTFICYFCERITRPKYYASAIRRLCIPRSVYTYSYSSISCSSISCSSSSYAYEVITTLLGILSYAGRRYTDKVLQCHYWLGGMAMPVLLNYVCYIWKYKWTVKAPGRAPRVITELSTNYASKEYTTVSRSRLCNCYSQPT